MKVTINKSQFIDALLKDEYAGWSYSQAETLFNYYSDLEEIIGEEIELDVTTIRCEWNASSIETLGTATIDALRQLTTILIVDDQTILIQNY